MMSPANQASRDVMTNWVTALRNNCMECHQEGRKISGRVQIFDINGQYAPNVPASKLVDAIRSGEMPKNRRLPDNDRVALLSAQAR